jgi:deoxyribonuclease-4
MPTTSTTDTPLLGCHISAAGGLIKALERAQAVGINTMQIHPSPPQRWNTKPFSPGVEKEFLAAMDRSCLKKVFFHGIYLINLANPDQSKRHLAELSLSHDLELADRIGGEGVIFHVGSLKDEPDESVGYQRAADSIVAALERAGGSAPLLLEVSAGSGKIIGSRFSELVSIYDHAGRHPRIRFALDTQHLWASGYDLAHDLSGLLHEIESSVGLDAIGAIHLNDSRSALGSHVDRHEDLGKGTIGWETLTNIVTHPKLRHIPFILETPSLKTDEGVASEMAQLRKMAGCS